MTYGAPSPYQSATPRQRLGSAILALTLAGLVGAGLLAGFAPQVVAQVGERLSVINLDPPLPPPPPAPPPVKAPVRSPVHAPVPAKQPATTPRPAAKGAPAPEGDSAPKRTRSPLTPLNPASSGSGATGTGNGAGVQGAGSGAGGIGAGSGAGGDGGNGGGGGGSSDAELISGTIGDADYPAEAGRQGVEGTVVMLLAVGVDGRVTGCRVSETSGSALLDQTACRLARQRYRFRPARDASGRPHADEAEMELVWRNGKSRR